MNPKFSGTTRWLLAALAAVAFMALGALGTWIYVGHSMSGMHMAGMEADMSSSVPAAPDSQQTEAESGRDRRLLPDVTIVLTPEAVERAGITVTSVREATSAVGLRLVGVVEPNAYRQVVVTPLVAGTITSVSAELGQRVRRGQPLAAVYSPQLADAQTRFLTMRAELDAATQELRRTERLVEIGAASAQELERAQAQHTMHDTDVESARSMLKLLGFGPEQIAELRSASDISSTVSVPAPLAGVVTKRTANVGWNVEPSTGLFTVVDLSTVWVIAEVYERDFAQVSEGSQATVTTMAYPDLVLQGKVSYIDPEVNPNTRTAKLRVEVENPRGQLRLGMYADVSVADATPQAVLVVPRTAVQSVGERYVVYVVDPTEGGRFVEREVRLGHAAGEDVHVVSGLAAGDIVVDEGTFFLRAERERLGLRVRSGEPP